jgi:23S rRNA pseudouridine2605 synthase
MVIMVIVQRAKNMKGNKIRLNHYLAKCGVDSRRKCDDFIQKGQVAVNGKIVTKMGVQIDPWVDVVTFNNEVVRPQEKLFYILLNKPLRTVTTTSDEKHRKTVLDIVRIEERIYPVGRLDYNTTGALLLTNDGDLAYFLAHPRFEISKIYRILLDKRMRPIDLHHFRKGLKLDTFVTSPCRIEEIRVLDNRSYLEVEIHEGKNRQIRRMFDSLNYNVCELERIEFAGLRIQNMKAGDWRFLAQTEISHLKEMVNLQRYKILGTQSE